MKNLPYDELKRKYVNLLEENRKLKARLRDITNNSVKTISHHSSVQENETLFSQAENTTFNLNSDAEFSKNITKVTCPVTKYSQSNEKIALFMSLFTGRTDVYAKKWRNKKGYSGYSPVCLNEWVPGLCLKPKGKCSKCKDQAFDTLTDLVIEKHLQGEYVIGIYPMHPDETCRFLAIDFDKQDWKYDIAIIRDICSEFNIPIAIERSQSGNGCHAWFFFEQNLPAVLARKFGTSLLTCGMSRRHEISFKSYDRLFPNQDTLPKGGFGNLIALPLQKIARENGNSVFIDENFMTHNDQWRFLSGIQRLMKNDVTSIITKLTGGDDLGLLKEDASESKPWKKQSIALGSQDFPETVTIVKSGMLYIEKDGLSQKALNTLKSSYIKNIASSLQIPYIGIS